jgi:hypothetical protein
MDWLYILIGIVFFIACWGFVKFAATLGDPS